MTAIAFIISQSVILNICVFTDYVGQMDNCASYFMYWGKTAEKACSSGSGYHLLPWHHLDVAACGWQMVLQNRFHAADIFAEIGFSREEGARWFAWFLGIHDLGKFSRGFQQLYAHASPDLVLPVNGKIYSERHDSLGYWLWCDFLLPRWREDNSCALPTSNNKINDKRTLDVWLKIVTGHHGKPPTGQVKGNLAFTQEDKIAAERWVAELGHLFGLSHFPECFSDKSWRKKLQQQSWALAGLTVLADWLGSNPLHFPLVSTVMPTGEYWQRALEQAQQALSLLPDASPVRPFDSPHTLFPFIEHFTPLQQKALSVDISAPGPQLLVLEDVTGAGKTEAAMILAHRLMSVGKGDSLYVGLPTMATSNAMFTRLAHSYRALFEQTAHPSLVLAHGARQMSVAFNHSLWSEDVDGQSDYQPGEIAASSACNRWFADSRKKSLLAEVGVGTLDQVLMAAMPFKHQSLRLLGLYGKILILDEVHAYDAYMVRLLEGLLTFHAAQGGSAIVLSATLPLSLRQKLLNAFQKGCGAELPVLNPDAGYPWFSHLTSQGLQESFTPTRQEVTRSVTVDWLMETQQALELIESSAHEGHCLCWIRNTVDDATNVYRQLRQRSNIPPENLLLFHSRFAFTDRMEIENQVLEWFGKESTVEQRRGKVLIATQVIEQSLDIDLDVMISDLAPIDLLIQRAGRLQRHQRGPRRAPTLHILAPDWQPDAKPGWLGETLRGTGAVYADHACLWRTQSVLHEKGVIRMPDDARELVESVYEEWIPAPDGLQRISDTVFGLKASEKGAAAQMLLDRDTGYDRNASDFLWSDEVELSTRLSEKNVDLYLAWQDLSPYAAGPDFAWEKSRLSVRIPLWEKIAAEAPHLHGDELERFREKIRNPTAQVLMLRLDEGSAFYSRVWGLSNPDDDPKGKSMQENLCFP